MKVQYQPELAQRQPLAEIAQAATPVLEQAIGPPAARVIATWGFRADERGRPLIHLTLADWSVEASAEFAPEELQSPDDARWRFYRLWGDLLQDASNRVSKELEAVLAENQGS
jgi:hypothetical protein